ncbi:MAG: transketolase [Christensenellaceae bacterium]
MSKYAELSDFATEIRVETLKALGKLGFGHLGGALSITDLLAVLYGKEMTIDPKDPKKADRDQFVLSKGHAGPALYATLALKGYFPMDVLGTINTPNTILPSHCDRNKTPGIDMSTGSLGQGMSTAIGIAMAQKMNGTKAYTYLVLGDGECDEGQVWEGALFAPQHKVTNLIAFVDYNKKQLDGYTKDVLDLGDVRQKFEDFGWFAQSIDGHDVDAIVDAIAKAKAQSDKPSMIVLNTVKGKGCRFAEEPLYNHHMTFTKDQVDEALKELGC